ncbi:Protoporphyrinogen IX oxidase, menaquinone-dependent (flavodoxin domain) [Peptoclostridium litorale DSM 5388]|uniref:Flavodoxin n=1 Tax=Peptoclostridium litorale DSM 5388 TaxID=1121324 RepID=A0A069RDN1_PEPLI|nr:flavodoxin domain-containing protein [Peptoclostridium litorale]KDR95116.1 flavodoxin [Peptoclostridium litorale DSM 5388]SIN74761.1 Protoporphyrinogen IX oxidase, menaquinone-dependent (flavodoxin domain) [Peptoclostridium litorale DSM 5388]
MEVLVVYKSKSGFTKKYANWIAEELFADVYEVSKVTPKMLKKYDTLIYGGGIYAASINGLDVVKRNMNILNGKNIVVFATGVSPPREEVVEDVKNKNFSHEEQKNIEFFYFRGGFDYDKLNFLDKFIMTLMKWSLKRKKSRTSDEEGMLAAYESPVDFTKKSNVDKLTEFVKEKCH